METNKIMGIIGTSTMKVSRFRWNMVDRGVRKCITGLDMKAVVFQAFRKMLEETLVADAKDASRVISRI